ncbi:MAG: hypothetical protein NC221_01650 [Duncaniella sp.]|nr:hypothetical protein [Muribaculum sp.]MCM1254811.1 hypothetical protein [Duncaniella sp.]
MVILAIKSDKIRPFGGIFSVIREFSPIERLIDSELGLRVKCVGYQYGEIIRTMMCDYLSGGDRANMYEALRDRLSWHKNWEKDDVESPDSLPSLPNG